MVVNDARAVIATADGTRTIAVDEVATGPGQTSLAAGEFIVEFEVDKPPAHTGDAYLRLTPRTEMDIAVVGAGARITLDADGNCTDARIALGAVAPTARPSPRCRSSPCRPRPIDDDDTRRRSLQRPAPPAIPSTTNAARSPTANKSRVSSPNEPSTCRGTCRRSPTENGAH